MVSLPFAERTFGDGAAAVGKIIRVENQAYQIGRAAGRLPLSGESRSLAAGLPNRRISTARVQLLRGGQLRPGVALSTAQAQLDTIAARLRRPTRQQPQQGFIAVPLQERLVSGVRSTLYLLLGAVGLVLLMASPTWPTAPGADPARAREIAVRRLGAGRWRV